MRSGRREGNLYKRRFTPLEGNDLKRATDKEFPEQQTTREEKPRDSEDYEEASPLNEEQNIKSPRRNGYYQTEYAHSPPMTVETPLSPGDSSDLYKELKKFWNDGSPDIIKLGRAKIQYEENIGPAQRHVERFVAEVVRSRRFDLASVGCFDKFPANSVSQEIIKVFFEGSVILQSISIRLALSAADNIEKATGSQQPVPGPSLQPSSFCQNVENPRRLNTATVKRAFWIDIGGDFRHINVTTLMENWRPQKGEIIMNLRACYRKIFSEITVDPRQIRQYSIRLSNRGRRFPGIKDLPQQILDILIEYTLAIFGLDHHELSEVDENLPLPNTEFVKNLGTTDEERFDRLLYLANERRNILQRAPRLIQEALSDIRQSTVEIEQLDDGSCTVNFRNNKRKAEERKEPLE